MNNLLNIHTWPWYKKFDVALLRKINVDWSNDFFDRVIPWLREANVWIPFYLFLIVFAIINLGRSALYWILGLAMTVTLSDQLSSNLVKKLVGRIRPCRDPEVLPLIHLRLDNCSGAFSFTSSHAANHSGVATFIIVTLYPLVGKWIFAILLWAAAISYAQMYVGVHYPLDIMGGTSIGVFAGIVCGKLFHKLVGLPPEEQAKLA